MKKNSDAFEITSVVVRGTGLLYRFLQGQESAAVAHSSIRILAITGNACLRPRMSVPGVASHNARPEILKDLCIDCTACRYLHKRALN
jgi:hypothetical protein